MCSHHKFQIKSLCLWLVTLLCLLSARGVDMKLIAENQLDHVKKTGARHPSLLPGIFTVFCPHGMTYGFGFKQLLINNIKKKLKHLRIQNFEVTICEVKGYDTYK